MSESWVEMDLIIQHPSSSNHRAGSSELWGCDVVEAEGSSAVFKFGYFGYGNAQTSENDRSATRWSKGGVKDPPHLQSTLPGLVQGCWCCRLTFRLESEWELRPSPQAFGYDSYNPWDHGLEILDSINTSGQEYNARKAPCWAGLESSV